MMEKRERVILDVDTGIDDALAILLALKSRRLVVEGITTGYGAVSLDQATENTLRTIEIAGAEYPVPVARGSSAPLVRDWCGAVTHIHGINGLGDVLLPEPSSQPLPESASIFISRKAHEYPGEITLICTARLTNLAEALKNDPTIARNIKQVVLMGGALRVPGNVTPYAEANIHDDPEAAQQVLASGLPLTMVGLDVTLRAVFHDQDMEYLKKNAVPDNREMISFIEQITRYYADAYHKVSDFIGCPLHDPLAVAVVIDPEIVRTEDLYITVETGHARNSGQIRENSLMLPKTNAKVCLGIDVPRFMQCLLDTLAN